MLGDEAPRRGDTLGAFELFLAERHGRMREPRVIEARRILEQMVRRDRGRDVVAAGKTPAQVAGADAKLQDRRHRRGFGEREALLDHPHHAIEVRPRIEQQQRGLERISVGALLDHARSFAIVFAHHDQRAAGDTG